MRAGLAVVVAGFVAAGLCLAAGAQEGQQNTPACPSSGFAAAYYGVAGDNDGQQRGYEIASPCIGKEVRDAAIAIGMGRWSPLGVKTLSTLRFKAEGKMAPLSGGRLADIQLDMSLDFTLPAARVDLQDRNGGARQISVFSIDKAWSEVTPGTGRASDTKRLAQLQPLTKLTPFGALWSVIEAEGTAKVSHDKNGRTLITGTSPIDGIPVSITLDEASRPVEATVKVAKRIYKATFSNYSDKWESPYLFVFPSRIDWTLDGKPFAALNITHFHSNPYVVFPPPSES